MNESVYLFENLGQIRDTYVLEAGERLNLFREKKHRSRRTLWRTLLMAAVLTALLGATAYAAGFLELKERIFPVEGTERVVVVPNGLKGTQTYAGTGEWWTWVEEHKNDKGDYSLSFLQGNDQKRKTCQLYWALTPEAAEKLYEIAETYDLELYSESVKADSMARLTELTGIRPFLGEGKAAITGGYVFQDGSFMAEGQLVFSNLSLLCELQRFSTGALYPYGAVTRLPEYNERDYENANGQTVNIVSFPGERMELWYLSSDGETFAALRLYDLPGKRAMARAGLRDRDDLARYLADRIDFAALCEKNDAVEQILSVPRGAADNREAAERLEDFYNSPMFCAAREFQAFFTANFYGASFTGVHGQEGYEDIDAKLEELAAKYGLRYATAKRSDPATWYDNGVETWNRQVCEEMGFQALKIYFIPKDALCTCMIHYADFADYQRIWSYETAKGQQIVCAADGPEKISGVYLFYETEDRYILVSLGSNDVASVEETAEAVDWTAFG